MAVQNKYLSQLPPERVQTNYTKASYTLSPAIVHAIIYVQVEKIKELTKESEKSRAGWVPHLKLLDTSIYTDSINTAFCLKVIRLCPPVCLSSLCLAATYDNILLIYHPTSCGGFTLMGSWIPPHCSLTPFLIGRGGKKELKRHTGWDKDNLIKGKKRGKRKINE